MSVFPAIYVILRVTHTVAGAAWVGGNIMYLLVVVPALRLAGPAPAVAARIANLFKRVVNVCIWVLLLSGVYLTFDRLTQTTLGLPYLIVLGCKIVLAVGMFLLAVYIGQSNIRRLAKRTTRFSKVAPQLVLALGILVFLLGAILNQLFEATIASH
jgi:uncharacterized membrane protein